MKKACVFDLDGTLLNTSYALKKCMNESLKILKERKNLELKRDLKINLKETKKFVGDGLIIYIKRTLNHLLIDDENLLDEMFSIYMEVAKTHNLYKVAPYYDISDILEQLKKKGVKLAILSNKMQEVVEANTNKMFRKGLFDKIYGERKGIKIKPDPSSLNALIKELGLKKEEVLYFGDTDVDMQTGKNAKVDGVGVLWGFREKKELIKNGAKYLIKEPREILELINV